MYQYEFLKEKCWFKKVCSLVDTCECNSACIRYAELDYLFYCSGLPKNKRYKINLTPDNKDIAAFDFLTEVKDDIVKFVTGGESLYLYSKYFGNGKTSWAIKLLQQYFNDIWLGNGFRCRGIFLHVPTFLYQLKQSISIYMPEFEELRQNITTADLVVWDDIASTKLSEYDHSILLTYLEQRIFACKANIYTGNLDEKEILSALGNRLASRVIHASSLVMLQGPDRRGNI